MSTLTPKQLFQLRHPLHVYERSKDNKEIYRCIHPECTSYNRVALLLGKAAECFKCHDKFILTKKQLKNFHPVCISCSKEKKSPTLGIGTELMQNIFDVEEEADILNMIEERKEG